MTVVDALDAATVRRWAGLAAAGLERAQDEINGLNVFPIPDRDTGTNMALTARSAQRAAAAETPTRSVPFSPRWPPEPCRALAATRE